MSEPLSQPPQQPPSTGPGASTPPPPPPPPPTNLAPPPGFQGYQAAPGSGVPLKGIGGISRASSILVLAAGVLALLAGLLMLGATGSAEEFLAGEISESEFLTSIAAFSAVSVLQSAVMLAAMVVTVIWMFRLASNLRTLQRDTTWGPGWTIGGWVLPPFLFVIPFLTLREMWKASDPDVPVGGEWRRSSVSPMITAWFVVFGVVGAILTVSQFSSSFGGFNTSGDALAEQVAETNTIVALSGVQQLVAAGLFVLVVRQLTERHRRLTGER